MVGHNVSLLKCSWGSEWLPAILDKAVEVVASLADSCKVARSKKEQDLREQLQDAGRVRSSSGKERRERSLATPR